MIAPIQTSYKGYKMRSRTEACWAVFFDALGIKWEYEPEGFDLGEAGWYLPDFWLPDLEYWIEIKGKELSAADKAKVKALTLSTGKPVGVFIGRPDYDPELERCTREYRIKGAVYRFRPFSEMGLDQAMVTEFLSDPDEYGGVECIETWIRNGGMIMGGPAHEWLPCTDDEYMQAVFAARSARFEHGEQPHIAQSAPPPLATHTIAALGAAPAGQIGVIAGKLVNPVILPAEQQGTVLRAGLFDVTGWARLKVPAAVYEATRSLWSPGQRVLLTGRLIPHDGDFAGALFLSDQPAKKLEHTILEVLRVQELPA